MATAAWRRLESRVADYFKGRRRPQHYGEQGPDINNPVADIEVKLRKKLPAWITLTLSKAEKWNKTKLTAVIWYEEGADNPEAGIAMLPAHDLRLLLEAFRESSSEPPLPNVVPLKSVTKARATSRWKSRRLMSRKFSK